MVRSNSVRITMNILQGHRWTYTESDVLAEKHHATPSEQETQDTATALLEHLNTKHQDRWVETALHPLQSISRGTLPYYYSKLAATEMCTFATNSLQFAVDLCWIILINADGVFCEIFYRASGIYITISHTINECWRC